MLTPEDLAQIRSIVSSIVGPLIAESEARSAERLERVETRLLPEFHKWASPVELRARSHAAALRAMDAEIESLGERVQKLEHPPQ